MKIRIATRGSELALAQSRWVAGALQRLGAITELLIIRTQGDILLDKPLHEIGGKGLFTKEVDRAVLCGAADLSVHSLKDMPVEDEEGLILGAIPQRESCNDVLVLHNAESMKIGCGSLRRRAQLAYLGEEYEFTAVRGNIHTRLEKMRTQNWAGLVVAEAALRRLGLEREYKYKILDILPAAGQGALGLRIRADDSRLREIVGRLNSQMAYTAAYAESQFLRALGGGCHLPAGIRSTINGSVITFVGGVFTLSGKAGVIMKKSGPLQSAQQLAEGLAGEILEHGGQQILDKLDV